MTAMYETYSMYCLSISSSFPIIKWLDDRAIAELYSLTASTDWATKDNSEIKQALTEYKDNKVDKIYIFNEDEDKRISHEDKIYELHNNIFTVYDK